MNIRSHRGTRLRRPTIRDVAESAGVAVSTVSRSFTNSARVNDSTRDHVLAVARKLGYSGASPAAKAFIRGRTETIGLVVPDIANPHFAQLIRGAAARAAGSNHTVVIADTDESREKELQQVQRLAKTTDGLVLVASRLSDEDLSEIGRVHSLVLVNRVVWSIDSVLADQCDSIHEVIAHLAQLGHNRIVYATGPATSWVATQRWKYLKNATHDRGLALARLGPYEPYFESGSVIASEVTRLGATAVVTHNAVMGLGTIATMKQRGVEVPRDLSVVSLDDITLAAHLEPAVTARRANQEDLGNAAVSALLKRLNSTDETESPLRRMIPAELEIRHSTAPPRSVKRE